MLRLGTLAASLVGAQGQVQEAPNFVSARERIQSQIHDERFLKTLSDKLFKMWQKAGLNEDIFSQEVVEFLRNYLSDPSCRRNPLPKTIASNQKGQGGLDEFDLGRVVYIYDPNEQGDGWTCGFRALCNLAAVEKILKDDLPLTHEEVGRVARSFYKDDEGIKRLVAYCGTRKKIAAAADLLKVDLTRIAKAKGCLSEDPYLALNILQQDYFIILGALHVLSRDTSPAIDIISLLGRAGNPRVKLIGEELLEGVIKLLQGNNKNILDGIEKDFNELIGQLPKEVVSLYSSEQTSEHRQKKIWSILLGAGSSVVRKAVKNVCSESLSMKEKIDILRGKILSMGQDVVLSGEQCAVARDKLKGITRAPIARALEALCECDKRLQDVINVLRTETCPKLVVAVALFNTYNFDEYDEIVFLLQSSKRAESDEILKKFSDDLRHHRKFQELITNLSDEKKASTKEQVQRTIEELRKITTPGNRSVLEKTCSKLLEKSNDADNIRTFCIREIKGIDREEIGKIIDAFIGRGQDRSNDDDDEVNDNNKVDIQTVLSLLDQVECEDTMAVIDDLEGDQPDIEAVCAKLDRSSNPHKDAVRKILKANIANLGNDIEILKKENPVNSFAVQNLQGLVENISKVGEYPTENDLAELISLKELGVEPDNVAFVGACEGIDRDVVFKWTKFTNPEITEKQSSELSAQQISQLIGPTIKKNFARRCRRSPHSIAHHFPCAVLLSGKIEHWIAASLVRLKGKSSVLIVIDSVNAHVRGDRFYPAGTDTMIEFLFNTVVR